MTSPLKPTKHPVVLAVATGSRIRRDPPPLSQKEISPADRDDSDRLQAAIGIPAFALAIFTIIIGFAQYMI